MENKSVVILSLTLIIASTAFATEQQNVKAKEIKSDTQKTSVFQKFEGMEKMTGLSVQDKKLTGAGCIGVGCQGRIGIQPIPKPKPKLCHIVLGRIICFSPPFYYPT
jgi:hypothetical protein